MTTTVKVENGKVVVYDAKNNQRLRIITGWPDNEKVLNAVCVNDDVSVYFNNSRVRCYNALTGILYGTF